MIIGAGQRQRRRRRAARGGRAAASTRWRSSPAHQPAGPRSTIRRSRFADPRVTIHLDDGRSFARNTARKYDLAVYTLVDSLVLHSGYSSLRLENFLFTREAFEDVKRIKCIYLPQKLQDVLRPIIFYHQPAFADKKANLEFEAKYLSPRSLGPQNDLSN